MLSYAAIVAMVSGDGTRAIEYARRSRPTGERDPQITSNYLRVLNSAGLAEEIERLIDEEEWIKDDPNCAFTLGLIYLGRGEFGSAESYFRSSLRVGGDNPHAHRLLAQAIVLQIDEIILNNPPLRLSEEMLARINEAEEHLTSAAGIFDGYENPSRLYETLLQRAYVRGLRGNTTGSLADCDRILQAEPKHPEALRQKGHTLLSVGRTEEALRYFKEIEDEEERSAATLAAALAHHREGRDDQVIELLAQLWQPKEWTRQQAILADLLLSAYHHTGDANRVSALTDELQRVHPDDPEALSVLARQCMREGRTDAALGNYTRALEEAAPGNQHDRISLELAEYYFETKRWADAAEHFRGKVELSSNNPLARKYLLSLYNSGARRAAMNLAKELRGGGEAIPFISEVEAQVLAAAGKFEDALKLFEQLAEKQPGAVTHRLWAVEMLRGLKNAEGARTTLEGIKLEEIKDDPTNLIRVAMLRQKLGMGGELPFAYRARRVGFRDKDVHDAYVTLFMNHTSTVKGDLDVDCVAVDHAVRLKDRKGRYESYLIVEQEEYDPQHNEIPPSDLRAAKLLGLRVGDRVTFNEGRADEAEYEIAEVQSKYVYAFQQTIINYNHWFGGGGEGLLVMNVEDGDFSGLFRMLDQQAERGRKISSLYNERCMPLGALARMRGRSLFEVWASLVSGEMRLFATTGEFSEIQRARDALAKTEDLVVEISSLLTLRYLGLLDKLPKAFRRVIVADKVLKEVERWSEEVGGQQPHMTVWKERDQYYRQDITEEVITRRREFLGEIKSFLEQYAEAVPAVKELDTPSEQLEQYKEVLGEMATASLFVASELELPLHVDDMALNLIASDQRWRIQGVPTQVVLLRFKSRGLISEAEYYAALKKLILGNYAHVWITSAALWWMCVDEGKKASEAMRLILRATLGPESVPEPSFAIGSQLIHRVWMEVSDREEKLKLVDMVVESLALGRDKAAVGTVLKESLPKLFRYLSSALSLLLKRVDEHLSGSTSGDDGESEETNGDGIGQGATAG